MIEIDGALGEGGGQILRTSIALSIISGEPVKIYNIRKNRPKGGGLRPQHITAINALKEISNSRTENVFEGSKEITFYPGKPKPGKYSFNIGTAGSISLVLQAILPAISKIDGLFDIHLIGGTDVAWSPPIDYLDHVLFPVLRRMGISIQLELKKRGYYPKGGGEVFIKVKGTSEIKQINAIYRPDIVYISGISHATNLPKHIAERQAKSAKEILMTAGYTNVNFKIEHNISKEFRGLGSGICIWANSQELVAIGGDALGSKGKRAEVVGQEAAEKIIESLETKMAFDYHVGDMLIPFLALAKDTSKIGVSKITNHLTTNITIVRKLLGTDISLKKENGATIIIVKRK